MKRILSTIAIIGITSQVQALTPTELIHEMKNHLAQRLTITHQSQKRPQQPKRKKHPQKSRATSHPRSIKIHRQKVEKVLATKTAIRRNFRTLDEYRKLQSVHRSKRRIQVRSHARTMPSSPAARSNRYLGHGWYVDEDGRYDEQCTRSGRHQLHRWRHRPYHKQHGYWRYRRQWYLTYLYERAPFYDQHGYYYGYFNQRGFMFEGQFYRYDRSYTYQDRLHGKELFAHRFYRPIRLYGYRDYGHYRGRGGVYFSWSF